MDLKTEAEAMEWRLACDGKTQSADIVHRLRTALAEAQRDLQEIRGVIGFPGSVALAEAGLTESLADVVRYTHRQWLTQTHTANQRVIRAEAAADAAQQEIEELRKRNIEANDALAEAQREIEELRAELRAYECAVDRIETAVVFTATDGENEVYFDGEDTIRRRNKILKAAGIPIREARRGDGVAYIHSRCPECGHRLREDMPASGCPQCGTTFGADVPNEYPEICQCGRCVGARAAEKEKK